MGGVNMYALIYDEFDLSKREKKVISVHKSRDTAEKTLEKRQRELGKKVWECNTRIVWVHTQVHSDPIRHRDCKITPDGQLYECQCVRDYGP